MVRCLQCQHLHTASGLDMNNVFVHEKRNLSILSFTNEEAESNGLADSPSCRYPNESRQLQYFHPPVYMSRRYAFHQFSRNFAVFFVCVVLSQLDARIGCTEICFSNYCLDEKKIEWELENP